MVAPKKKREAAGKVDVVIDGLRDDGWMDGRMDGWTGMHERMNERMKEAKKREERKEREREKKEEENKHGCDDNTAAGIERGKNGR